jgi:hypothetical protein
MGQAHTQASGISVMCPHFLSTGDRSHLAALVALHGGDAQINLPLTLASTYSTGVLLNTATRIQKRSLGGGGARPITGFRLQGHWRLLHSSSGTAVVHPAFALINHRPVLPAATWAKMLCCGLYHSLDAGLHWSFRSRCL